MDSLENEKKNKVLLINPTIIFRNDKTVWKYIIGVTPPIGILHIASILRENGVLVKILDMNAERVAVLDFQKYLGDEKYDFVGIAASTTTINGVYEIARICKSSNPECKIILGGIHPTNSPDEVINNSVGVVDYVARGESELTFKELIEGKDPGDVLSLSYKKDSVIVHNPSRPLLQNLDELPDPAYDLLQLNRYRPTIGSYKKLPAMHMVISRGCPGQCTFCHSGSANLFGKAVRYRSQGRIFNQIKDLHENHGINEIIFYDDNFTSNKQFVTELCNSFINYGLKISWTCFSRADFIRDLDMFKLMKKAGCHQVCVGIESGDETILKNIKKYITREDAKRAVTLLREAKIDSRFAFMLGLPGETVETMQKTLDFALELDPDYVLFNINTPYPGTEMYDWAKKNGYFKREIDYTKWDAGEPILDLPTVDTDDIKRYYKKCLKAFYLRPRYIIKSILRIRSFTEVKDAFKVFFYMIKPV